RGRRRSRSAATWDPGDRSAAACRRSSPGSSSWYDTCDSMKRRRSDSSVAPRDRIIIAAIAIVRERGYAGANTNEIAARAKVSKRELYAEFGNKQGIFAACIADRAARMRAPLRDTTITNREDLIAVLRGFGTAFLDQVYDPD